ncbi:hypothetical protein ACHAWF_008395, partial [Thalassiosira exigua]
MQAANMHALPFPLLLFLLRLAPSLGASLPKAEAKDVFPSDVHPDLRRALQETCKYHTQYGSIRGEICINDCPEPNNADLYDSMELCCQAKHNYGGTGGLNDCLDITEGPTAAVTDAPSPSPTLRPSSAPAPCLYYSQGGTVR